MEDKLRYLEPGFSKLSRDFREFGETFALESSTPQSVGISPPGEPLHVTYGGVVSKKRLLSPELETEISRKRQFTEGNRISTSTQGVAINMGPEISSVGIVFPTPCPQKKCPVLLMDLDHALSHWISHPLGQFRCPKCKNRVIKSAESLKRYITTPPISLSAY
jgi:hypothetical protein